MKKLISLFLIVAVFFAYASCNRSSSHESEQKTVDSTEMPVISFTNTSYDFGSITQGDTVKYSFAFTNLGKTPLTIMEATPSCGCTTPNFTKTPIVPGGKGSIDVVFNSTNFTGKVMKSVQVISNAKNTPAVIYLEGNINPKK